MRFTLCVLVAILTYVRYRQVTEYLSAVQSPHPRRVNKASLIIGFVSAFGATLVANFQVRVQIHYSTDIHVSGFQSLDYDQSIINQSINQSIN